MRICDEFGSLFVVFRFSRAPVSNTFTLLSHASAQFTREAKMKERIKTKELQKREYFDLIRYFVCTLGV